MARYAWESSRDLVRTRSTPHAVSYSSARLQGDEWTTEWTDVLRWVNSSEAKGYFRYEEMVFLTIFYFSNPDTAFAFKMRFC